MKSRYAIEDFLEIKSASSPHWNHDGSKIGYLANITGVWQIYLMSKNGGGAEQLTIEEDPVGSFSFSPVREELIFSRCEGGNENYQLYLLDLDTKNIQDLTKKPNTKFKFGGWSRDGKYIAYASNERNGKDFDVYVMDVRSRERKCVFDLGGSCSSTGFSPSGRTLYVARTLSATSTELFQVVLVDGAIEQILKAEHEHLIFGIKHLPDESGFFFITDKDRDCCGLALYDIASKTERYILTPEWDVSGLALNHKGTHLLVWVNEDGYHRPTIYEAKSMAPIARQHLPKGNITSCSWTKDASYLTFSFSDETQNGNIHVWSRKEDKHWQVTKMPQGVPKEELVRAQLIRYESFDGLSIPAFVYLPKEIPKKGKKVPVIIYIHGGPESQYHPVFSSLTQYLLYEGFAVIAPNVRGSAGYGKRYIGLDDVEKRMDSIKDLAALHRFIKSYTDLDADNVFLWGGSYGGYMVLAGLAFYPELWAGGVDIVGISNLVTFLENTAAYRRELREKEYGSLQRNRAFLASVSPINHVESIKAPLFIIHGANDPRVPLSEAKRIYESVLSKGGVAELLIYEDEGHGLSKLRNRIEAFTKAGAFLKAISGLK